MNNCIFTIKKGTRMFSYIGLKIESENKNFYNENLREVNQNRLKKILKENKIVSKVKKKK